MPNMLTEKEITDFRKRLDTERALLERELSALGKGNQDNPSGWVPAKPEGDEFGADRNDNADIIEDMEEDAASATELEARLATVVTALERIDAGIYGVCDVCNEPIEKDRLNANPAATTCKVHMQ